jgi:RNA recognition motif-containing protein
MNLYVGNLSYSITEDQLRKTFAEFGAVKSARLIMDRETNRPRGFGFVEMEDQSGGMNAIDCLNDKELDGRRIVVNEARAKSPRR